MVCIFRPPWEAGEWQGGTGCTACGAGDGDQPKRAPGESGAGAGAVGGQDVKRWSTTCRLAGHGQALVPMRMPLPARAWRLPLRWPSIRPRPPVPAACGLARGRGAALAQRQSSPSPHLWGARLTAMWSGRAIEAETWREGGRYSRTHCLSYFPSAISPFPPHATPKTRCKGLQARA